MKDSRQAGMTQLACFVPFYYAKYGDNTFFANV
jgi:hypothetical protein